MKKKVLVALLILLLVPLIVHAVSNFVIKETDLLKVEPEVNDPDKDRISVEYASPLNSSGEWQTTYGDAGRYTSKITVSDGLASDSQDITILVEKKKETPKIEFSNPGEESLTVDEGQTINFEIKASDLNNDELEYEWYINDEKETEGPILT